ncbi:HEPN domain-containing protein [Clostridium tagluense]|uniref:HEPN domain-containing protein n=1 Tax=Clostridium tagluense TaxID=360422 RepID=UPI001CF2570A|nr:HEPN domain-containing protein [Clostridium tagluense]MCB2312692.1 HEPN domain-containing protein [Clostridium tagluense]MCB2317458.1 HEPN domain-containing protein [Clostridium tagluense]MCB2322193.1 HEPN domain-containing protein [Clostridium tagluense]MCB2327199.1 HEPN domain-containing protein [Clostridium tagluense]MCB2331959.1 HEPN domain-containing protein [Clostridium tagluense]
MDSKQVSKEWFEFAKRDLGSAKFLINMYPKPIEIICYHCEQSAEKYLKGYTIFMGNNLERTHDIVLLNNKCKNTDKSFEYIEDDCIDLVPYGVQVRYPYQLEVNEDDMRNAIDSAERIQNFIEDKLK